jgi:hypothetical protein
MHGRWSLVAGLLVSTVFLWILLRTVHLGDIRQTLAAIDPWYILAAIVKLGSPSRYAARAAVSF